MNDGLRRALEEIAAQDAADIALDPDWPRRVALAALVALPSEADIAGSDNCGRCHRCLDGKLDDYGYPIRLSRFIVCPDCGNKRCPKASDHKFACTGSNEPGQPGSVYS